MQGGICKLIQGRLAVAAGASNSVAVTLRHCLKQLKPRCLKNRAGLCTAIVVVVTESDHSFLGIEQCWLCNTRHRNVKLVQITFPTFSAASRLSSSSCCFSHLLSTPDHARLFECRVGAGVARPTALCSSDGPEHLEGNAQSHSSATFSQV